MRTEVRPPEAKFNPSDPAATRHGCALSWLQCMCSKQRWCLVRFLQDHGYVVFSSVLPPAACECAKELVWDFLEQLGTGVDRRLPATWTDDRCGAAAADVH